MANYTISQDAQRYAASVYTLVPAPLDSGAGSHDITLDALFFSDKAPVVGMGYLIQALRYSRDAADNLTLLFIDPDPNAPVLSLLVTGADDPLSNNVFEGQWFPQGTVLNVSTTTGTDVKVRLAVTPAVNGC